MQMQDSLKILCLHGYRQNETKFRSQTGALRKLFKKRVELVFTSAPHIIANTPPEEDQRSWWFTTENSYSSCDVTPTCIGFEKSIEFLSEVFKTLGPFNGILGFSQGACLAGIMASMLQRNELPEPIKFNFIISVSGFRSRCKSHLIYYSEPIKIRSLHVFGNTDRVIDPAWSEELANDFDSPSILQHSGGHFVPAHSSLKENYLQFFNI